MNISDAKLICSKFETSMGAIGHFEQSPVLAIAVSGGSDSMALALLASEWVKVQGGKLIALSVDHGLRENSRLEIVKVKQWMKNYNISHHCLNWSGKKKESKKMREMPVISLWKVGAVKTPFFTCF